MTERRIIMNRSIKIDSTNNILRARSGAAYSNLELTAGTYYLTGATSLIQDEIKARFTAAFGTALTGASGADFLAHFAAEGDGTTYQDTPTARLTFTSAATFQLLFGDAATTFDGTLIGFNASTVNATSASGTADPSTVWIGDQAPSAESYGAFTQEIDQHTAKDGTVYTFKRGDQHERHSFDFNYILPERTVIDRKHGAVDESKNRTFENFIRLNSGQKMRIHKATILNATQKTLTNYETASSAYQLGGAEWIMGAETLASFSPSRFSAGLELYGFGSAFLKAV